MTSLTIEMEVDYPKLYKFGYSNTNDIETVQNWQIGNNRFIRVPNGRKYLFAVHLRDAFAPTLVSEILVSCNCELLIYSVTKTLRPAEQAEETDWSSGETTEQNDAPESDWTDGETTACILKINTLTKTLR
jgi:hypothetical protein